MKSEPIDLDPIPLFKAAQAGDQNAIQRELARDPGPGARDWALFKAAQAGHAPAVEQLVAARANPHAEDSEALVEAARAGHAEVVRVLVAAGADVHADDNAALRAASARGHAGAALALLEGGADFRAPGGEAVQAAALGGHGRILDLFVARGLDPMDEAVCEAVEESPATRAWQQAQRLAHALEEAPPAHTRLRAMGPS